MSRYQKWPVADRVRIASEPGTICEVGARYGIARSTIHMWRTRYGKPEMIVKGVSTLRDADGNVSAEWQKTRLRGLAEPVIDLPDPKRIVSTATLRDQEGRITAQWTKEVADKAELDHLWRVAAEEMSKSITYRVDPVPVQDQPVYAKRCVVIPLGDMHVGMWSSAVEGGGEWNLDVAERLLADSIDELLASTAPSEQCVIIGMGDWFHYAGTKAVTPKHGHILDADGRFVDMIRVGIRMFRRCVDQALRRHQHVHVIVAAGNHDDASAVYMREAMGLVYENEPRISVDRSAQSIAYHRYERCMIAVHHGDLIKPDRLPLTIAASQPAMWGETSYRLVLTGHVHHRSAKEHPGVHVETVGIIAPTDQHAQSHGYRSDRTLMGIVLGPLGEVQRHTIRIQAD